MNTYDEDNSFDYDGDDLEALGQRESWEHSQAEMRDDTDYRDPSKESREPKFAVPPRLPEGWPPPPDGYVYWGLGPIPHPVSDEDYSIVDQRPIADVIAFIEHCWGCTYWSDLGYTGDSDVLHYAIRRDSPYFALNFIDEKL